MHYTTSYNRANLQVVHPQLDQNIGEQRIGRKRFDVHKNEESSGLSYGYGLNNMPKKSYSQDSQPVPPSNYQSYLDYSASSYKPIAPKQVDYRPEPQYRDQSTNFTSKGQITQNAPRPEPVTMEPVRNPYESEPRYQDYNEAYQNPYEQPGYKDFKYSQQYEDPQTLQYKKSVEDNNENLGNTEQPEPKKIEYVDEIEKLKDELRRKEEELALYSQSLEKNVGGPDGSQESMYSRINKAMFDKQRTEEQKKINSSTLEYQLNEKTRMRMMAQQEREREQAIRLEMLRKLKEDEAFERMEKMKRAKEYREQLEVQNLVKSNLKHQEKVTYRDDVPKAYEMPPPPYAGEPYIRSNNSSHNISYTPGKFTKKTPKTICFNPITGVLKDTSQYVYGSFPSQNIKDPSITYLKNQSNIPELAAHPAFHQHLFTKNHPKVVPSFPITGTPGPVTQDYKEADTEMYKGSDKHMAEYGHLMMQNKNPTYN